MKTCIIVFARNEEKQLDEWINYHLNLGFDHIFILDNNDEDKPLIINNDDITIIPYHVDCNKIFIETGKRHCDTQIDAYNSIIKQIYDDGYEYCAFIDVDEFITFNSKYTNIKDFIQYEMISKSETISELIWEIYTDNEIIWEKDCKNNIRDTYTTKFEDAFNYKLKMYDNYSWTKCILKLFPYTKFDYTLNDGSGNVHWPSISLFKDGTYKHNIVNKSIVVVNHYRTQCLERYVKHKILNQNFIHIYPNLIRTYFTYNKITLDKLNAFKKLFDSYNININENINILYNHIGEVMMDKGKGKTRILYLKRKLDEVFNS